MHDYDLEAVGHALKEQGCHRALTEMIERAMTTASAATDLQRARQALEHATHLQTVGNMPESFSLVEASGVLEALSISAIIHYARATDTAPIMRGRWFSAKGLSQYQRATHKMVMHLRNKEIAHFGKGTPLHGEPLLKETFFLRTGSHCPVNFHASRWATKPEFLVDMTNLTITVLDQAETKVQHWFSSITEELRRLLATDSSIHGVISRYPVSGPMPNGPGISDVEQGGFFKTMKTRKITRPMNDSQ